MLFLLPINLRLFKIYIQVVLLNHITWQPLSKLYMDPVIRECNYLTKVYKEYADSEKVSNKRFASCEERVCK